MLASDSDGAKLGAWIEARSNSLRKVTTKMKEQLDAQQQRARHTQGARVLLAAATPAHPAAAAAAVAAFRGRVGQGVGPRDEPEEPPGGEESERRHGEGAPRRPRDEHREPLQRRAQQPAITTTTTTTTSGWRS